MTACPALVHDRLPAPQPRPRPQLRLVTVMPRLSPAEAEAVMIGRGDMGRWGWDGSAPQSPLRRLAARIFTWATGIRGVAPLADERLEAFRLFACMVRCNDRRSDAAAARLTALGVHPDVLLQAIRLALS